MIIAERKSITDIWQMIEPFKRIALIGCRGCVTVCMAGGAKEVAVLAAALRLAAHERGRELVVFEEMVERQCEYEFIRPLQRSYPQEQAVEGLVSLACGIGVQALAECFPHLPVLPGLNTSFLGMPERSGVWVERCHACGQCILDSTGAICPIARCAKNLLNGPCGGSQEGMCEIGNGVECAWHLIYERLARLNRLDSLQSLALPKNWAKDRDGGHRRLIREDWEDEV